MHDGLTGTVVGLALAATAGVLGCAHPPPPGPGGEQSEERRLAGADGWLLGRSLGVGPGLSVVLVHGVGGSHGLRLEPVVLVGHGTGAQVVARYAERNPDRVLGLVLINPVSGNAEAGRIADLPETKFRSAIQAWLVTLLGGAKPETRDAVLASVQTARLPAMRSMLADAAGNDLPASLAAYPGPVLILTAPDEKVPGPLREGIEVKRLSGGSHWSPLDEADEVNAELRTFLQPLDAASRPPRRSR